MQVRRLLCILAVAACARAQEAGNSNLSCVKSLVVPTYPTIAKQALVTGWFVAKLTVGSTGRAEKIKVEQKLGRATSLTQIFVNAIEAQLKAAQFEVTCQGSSVTLEFSFEIHEDLPAAPTGPDRVVFRGPNTFVIATPPKLINF